MAPPSSSALPKSTSSSSSSPLLPSSPPPSSSTNAPPPPPPAPALDLNGSSRSPEETSLLPTTRSSSEDSSSLRKSSGSEEGGTGSSRESRQVVFLPTLEKEGSEEAGFDDLSISIKAPFMDRGGTNRMSGMSYSSSSGSGSLSLTVPKGSHSPRRESSYDFSRSSMMLRPMSYASEIGFDPEVEVHHEVFENGPEGDDWMYGNEKEMEEVMRASTAYGQGRFVFMRVANLFCLIFLVLLLLLLFIGYPILDRFVLHGFSGGGRYSPNPVARPLGTYGAETSSFEVGVAIETLAAATATAAATTTGGLFGRRVA